VTLRCRPRPRVEQWWSTSTPAATIVADGFRPWSVLSDGSRTTVLLAGEPADVEWGVGRLADAALVEAPTLPSGPHRGRISVPPGRLDALVGALRDVEWCAEWGVGTVHVACADEATLAAARVVAHDHGGWLLREAGAPTLDPFGVDLPNAGLAARVRAALDPDGRMARGRFA
jgi:hypothetical protein